jgi:hypothetical protein
MGILTDEMKRVVTQLQLCYAATVTPDGKQNLSPKGSITVLSDDELGFADLASPGTIENLRHNRAIELNVVDPFTRRGFRFKGRARVMKDPEAHRRIAQVLGPDYPFEQVVKIRVDLASEVFSPVYTLTRTSEAERLRPAVPAARLLVGELDEETRGKPGERGIDRPCLDFLDSQRVAHAASSRLTTEASESRASALTIFTRRYTARTSMTDRAAERLGRALRLVHQPQREKGQVVVAR